VIAEKDPLLTILGISEDLLYEAVAESELSGEPYIALCTKCSEFKVCLVLCPQPIDKNTYRIVLKGLLISVSRDRVFDEVVEKILRASSTIKYSGNTVSFYIPRSLIVNAYKLVCSGKPADYVVEAVAFNDIATYFGEEYGDFESSEMA